MLRYEIRDNVRNCSLSFLKAADLRIIFVSLYYLRKLLGFIQPPQCLIGQENEWFVPEPGYEQPY
jgi:hypothetical protein